MTKRSQRTLFGLLALIAAFGLILTGCPDPNTETKTEWRDKEIVSGVSLETGSWGTGDGLSITGLPIVFFQYRPQLQGVNPVIAHRRVKRDRLRNGGVVNGQVKRQPVAPHRADTHGKRPRFRRYLSADDVIRFSGDQHPVEQRRVADYAFKARLKIRMLGYLMFVYRRCGYIHVNLPKNEKPDTGAGHNTPIPRPAFFQIKRRLPLYYSAPISAEIPVYT